MTADGAQLTADAVVWREMTWGLGPASRAVEAITVSRRGCSAGRRDEFAPKCAVLYHDTQRASRIDQMIFALTVSGLKPCGNLLTMFSRRL